MPISLIANVAVVNSALAIGRNNELLFKLSKDMKFFADITSAQTSERKNIILMGHKTYKSIPGPLKNRINLVLTGDKSLITKNILRLWPDNMDDTVPYYISMDLFTLFYTNKDANVFVIGGSEVYNYFLSTCSELLTPKKLYITHVLNPRFVDPPNKFMDNFDARYKLIGYTEKIKQNDYNFRTLIYSLSKDKPQEKIYFKLIKNILANGNLRSNRTDTDTISVFGARMEFNISQSIPMMTTRKIPFKAIVEELLWFCRGDTDARILQAQGVSIWNGNTSREFLDQQNLEHYPEGILGPGYGFQWRHFGADYNHKLADSSQKGPPIGGFDQLEYIVNLLKKDPFSRRIMLSTWNPPDFNKVALLPCHITVQFYVEEIKKVKYLSCQFTMRSSDALAWAFNVVSYTILTYILAMKCDMKPHKIIYIAGDTHIYTNHLAQVHEQMSRSFRPAPKLYLDPSIADKDWKDIKFTDFELIGYFPHKPIKMPMAI
jgi:thymidylate synthase